MYIASWRTCVASQMVSTTLKCFFSSVGPYFFSMHFSNIFPMNSVSPFSIVVWLAIPTASRCTSGSKPGEMAFPNRSRNPSRLSAPSAPRM